MRPRQRPARGRCCRPRFPRWSETVFERILVPLDLSGRHERTIKTASDLALRHRARVTLLHVVHQIPNVAAGELHEFYRRLERVSARRLERIAHRFAAKGVAVAVTVCIGEPAHEIVETAARRKIDLIVMGSHQVVPGRPATGWGTTSYKVGIFCRCPILLVK
jgi:nucleotide-binding universal stress UspA family protein